MANTKISQLTALTSPTGNEELVYAYNNTNGKMTVDTVKTYIGAGKQDTLVSWTNIKTINGYDLLGSWNIVISGGGWDGQIIYEAIVDYSGNGDYTTLWAALQAWATSIYIKNGTYTESPVEVTDNNFLVVWETEWWVILNYELTSSKQYCIKMETSTKTAVTDVIYNTIKNVTFNVDMKSGTWTNCIVNAHSINDNPTYELLLSECTVNAVNKSSASQMFSMFQKETYYSEDWSAWNSHCVANNCTVMITNWTGLNVDTRYNEASGNDWRSCYIVNSKIYVINDGSWVVQITNEEWRTTMIGCEILASTANGTWAAYIQLDNAHGCNITWYANSTGKWSWSLRFAEWCRVHLEWFSSYPVDFSWETEVKIWASSTSYSVWDYVRLTSYIYKCIEAHTSGDNIDFSKFEYIGWFNLTEVSRCIIGADLVSCNVNVTWNIIQSGMTIVAGDLCVFSGNVLPFAKVLKLVGKWDVVTSNTLEWFSVATTWYKGIYYVDNYNIVKDNVLTWTNTPVVDIVWTATSTSKVSDNVIF